MYYSDEPVEYKGYTIKFRLDEDAEDPRVNMSSLGHMICFHPRYTLGDKHNMSKEELLEMVMRSDVLSLPLVIYDHSGLGMSTGRNSYPYNCPWDSSHVGYIYVTKEELRKEYGVKNVTRKITDLAYKILHAEVELYHSWLSGDVWGWEVEDGQGNEVDSCWGYYGWDDNIEYMIEMGKEAVDWRIEQQEKKGKEIAKELQYGFEELVLEGTWA